MYVHNKNSFSINVLAKNYSSVPHPKNFSTKFHCTKVHSSHQSGKHCESAILPFNTVQYEQYRAATVMQHDERPLTDVNSS